MRVPALLPLVALLPPCTHAPPREPLPTEPKACFAEVAGRLSGDDLEGRGVGTAGLDQAVALTTEWFARAGLEPAAPGYRQPFDAVVGVSLGSDNHLKVADQDLVVEKDFVPLGFSSSGGIAGDVVFAGYGITAPELSYDDYAGLDVKGKVVLALRYEPGSEDEKSPFDGRRPTRFSDLRYKAHLAKQAGAAALVLVTGPGGEPDDAHDMLPALKVDGPSSDAGIPVLQVTRAVAEAWVKPSGATLADLQSQIDSTTKPASKALPGVTVGGTVSVVPVAKPVANVVGLWKGSGALAGETVVVGAHLDHLGMGGRGSLRPDATAIHNGADDNASGVAGVLCAVDHLRQASPEGDRRSLLVIAFTAEEIGLGGSGWYVDHPLRPLDSTVAMVNLDMVGRVRDGKISALGSDTAKSWDGWLDSAAAKAGLQVAKGGDGYGPSDQMSFYAKNIPVVHLFSGSHAEYHTPDDDFATLNVDGGGQVAVLTAELLGSVLTAKEAPAYVPATSSPPILGDARGYGAYLGTIPDYTAMEQNQGGVLLSGVRAGGPAEKAGIKGGDRIVDMGGVEIRNLYDMTFVLRDHRPGESLVITVLRDGQRVPLNATLEKRGEAPPFVPTAGTDASALLRPEEKHLADLRQLTNGGENAEAYWSPDGKSLFYQHTPADGGCDQQYILDLTTGTSTLFSSGKGRTTCGYYEYPRGDRFIYATTEAISPECPPPPDRSKGYTWALYPYDLVWQRAGEAPVPFLPSSGYDAEATACHKDGRLVFTSTRDGDLELYTVNADGSDLRRLTNTVGYDGGAFFTADCEHIVFRASRPEGKDLADYQALLKQNLVRPTSLEIYRMKSDGTELVALTHNGAGNFGPYAYPDDSAVIYASNASRGGPEFDLYSVPWDGGEPERITFAEGFDGFPMFSHDGKWLVFASNRGATNHQTNLFLARWVP